MVRSAPFPRPHRSFLSMRLPSVLGPMVPGSFSRTRFLPPHAPSGISGSDSGLFFPGGMHFLPCKDFRGRPSGRSASALVPSFSTGVSVPRGPCPADVYPFGPPLSALSPRMRRELMLPVPSFVPHPTCRRPARKADVCISLLLPSSTSLTFRHFFSPNSRRREPYTPPICRRELFLFPLLDGVFLTS